MHRPPCPPRAAIMTGCLLMAAAGCSGRPAPKTGLAAELEALDRHAEAVRTGGGSDRAAALDAALGHEDPSVRGHAAVCVAHANHWAAMPGLIKLVEDPDRLVRARAAVAIDRLLGLSFDFDPDAPAAARSQYLANVRACYAVMRENPPPRYR